MPSTYTLISGSTLGSSAASYTFSAIPSTFTDLVVRYSARTNASQAMELITYTLDGITSSDYSVTTLIGNSSVGSSSRQSNVTVIRAGWQPAGTATSNTFGSAEIYIPSYAVSQNKPTSNFSVAENNSASADDAYINTNAGLMRVSSSIASITLQTVSANSFVAGSSFYLYGIKNS